MLANYYKTAVRNITRSRFYAFINIIGLSVGIAFTLLIGAYCWSESQVNRKLRHADRQYILISEFKNAGGGPSFTTLGPLARALKENYPALVANFYRWDGITSAVSYGDKHFREGLQVGDSTLLSMYGFALLHGDAATALNQPFSVVITDEKAIKYFGRTDVVGQNLVIDNFSGGRQNFRITGVLKKPSNNSVTFINDANDNGVFIPSANLPYFGRNMDWPNVYIPNFVELQPGVRPEQLAGPIAQLIKMNAPPVIQANLKVHLQPLPEFYRNANGGVVEKMLYTLSFVALFIVVMAMINFVNLSVSRSTSRMKEIGIRKVLGSVRRQLRLQFLTESIVLSALATGFALLLYTLGAPLLSGMLGKDIPSLWELPFAAWIVIGLFAVFTGWLAGLYPAILLSGLASVDSLKGKIGSMKENLLLRKGLVGFQFATATVVFVGAIIVSQEISLFFSDRLGYNKDYIVSAALPRDWSRPGVHKMTAIRDVFARMPVVKDVTLTYAIPNGMGFGGIGIYRQGSDSTRAVVAGRVPSDEHYAATFQIPMAAGVFFNAPGQSAVQDSLGIVLNETAVKALGYASPADAVGQKLRLFGVPDIFTVSGVIKDYHFDAMGAPIQPGIYTHVSGLPIYRYFAFKLQPGNIGTAIASLQRQWAALMPGAPFEYHFMDESLKSVYNSELRLRKAASTATALAFVIVLLGVAGLVANSVRRRSKEIAIRKVIGASAPGIVRLFVRDYLPVLLIAGLVASPVAWWVMQRWLDGYATRITITAWPFVLAIGCLAVMMVVLIALQTIAAALSNPVRALRSE